MKEEGDDVLYQQLHKDFVVNKGVLGIRMGPGRAVSKFCKQCLHLVLDKQQFEKHCRGQHNGFNGGKLRQGDPLPDPRMRAYVNFERFMATGRKTKLEVNHDVYSCGRPMKESNKDLEQLAEQFNEPKRVDASLRKGGRQYISQINLGLQAENESL